MARPHVNVLPNANASGDASADSLSVQTAIAQLKLFLAKSLQGKTEIIDKAVATYIAGGHLLLEGPAGTGKTSLAKSMSRAFGGSFNRIQMTSDLLPSDVVGILRLNPSKNDFEFREGPIFANFVLADELNRTPPKTQSALLEAMEEGTVSVDRQTYALPRPFFLIATQNPMEFHGVYPLAESQLDRFMLQLNFDPPSEVDELKIYQAPEAFASRTGAEADVNFDAAQMSKIRGRIQGIFIEGTVLEYLTKIVRETRTLPGVNHGVSVRGGLQFLAAAKAYALVQGREFVTPEDIRALAPNALAHRLTLAEGDTSTQVREQLIFELLKRLPSPQ